LWLTLLGVDWKFSFHLNFFYDFWRSKE